MSIVSELPPLRLNIRHLRQLHPLHDLPPLHLRLPRHLHPLQMVRRLVLPRRSSSLPPKHVNLHVSLPLNSRRPSLPRPTSRAKPPSPTGPNLCTLAVTREAIVLAMGEQSGSKGGVSGYQ